MFLICYEIDELCEKYFYQFYFFCSPNSIFLAVLPRQGCTFPVGHPTGIGFLSASRQAFSPIPVKLWLTAIPVGCPTGNTIPDGYTYFPVGF
jgi:hypothetical protein